jgi:transcription-repair coupling factor (superfamily II helicase)
VRLFALARLNCRCRVLEIARLDAGPQAIALTFRPDAKAKERLAAGNQWEWRGERLVYISGSENADELLSLATGFLDSIDSD